MSIKKLAEGRARMLAFHRRGPERKEISAPEPKVSPKGTGDTLEESMKKKLLLRPATRVVPSAEEATKTLLDPEAAQMAQDPLRKRKRGRPAKYDGNGFEHLTERRVVTLGISVSRKEEVLLRRFADDEGKPFAVWAREVLFASKGYKVPHRVSNARTLKKIQ